MQAGDRVLVPGWGGSSIKVGEEVRVSSCRADVAGANVVFVRQEYFMFRDQEILAKIQE